MEEKREGGERDVKENIPRVGGNQKSTPGRCWRNSFFKNTEYDFEKMQVRRCTCIIFQNYAY